MCARLLQGELYLLCFVLINQCHACNMQSMSDVEQSYSQSIARLVRSSAYTFHSNILMQWLGSDPYEEIGYVYTLAIFLSS